MGGFPAIDLHGPAYAAGIRQSDLIVAINGQAIESVDAVHRILAEQPIGQTLHLVLIRAKELMEVDVVPTEAPQ